MKYEAEESQNQRRNLYGSAENLGQREPRHPCDSRQAVQETEVQGKGVGVMNLNFALFNLNICPPWWVFVLIPLLPFILAGIIAGIVWIVDRYY